MRLLPNHRRVTAAAAAALVTGAGLLTAPAAGAFSVSLGPVATPVLPRCEPNIVVIVPGGANSVAGIPDNVPVGGYTADLGARIDQFGHATSRTVSYDSGAFVARDYRGVAADATNRTRDLVRSTAVECPGAKISLYGYSLGADAAAHVAAEIGQGDGPVAADRFGSGVFQANPYRGAATAQGGTARPGTGILGDLSGSYGVVGDRIMDVCDNGDFTCDSDTWTGDVRANRDAFLGVSARAGYGALATIPGDQRSALALETLIGVLPGTWLHTNSYSATGSFSRGEGFLRGHMG
ncbi:cutinase family protein [uncultured Corynebacterium sp.]|uniref:cutinase family protein n=1 Tax=uncultured Corynebacterium sp. TaxID=159447 RepID=UPI0025EDDA55|nr:cutinase family protein [uncultured Corynebacterium sp.]